MKKGIGLNKLQLSTLATLLLSILPAQAALYQVVEVTPGIDGSEYYGTAIQPSEEDYTTSDDEPYLGCFGTDCGDGADYKLAGETRDRPEGFSYREEVPFAMDNSFRYIEDDDTFEDYCWDQLGYSTCEYWADDQYWDGWYVELYGGNPSNSRAFIEGTSEAPSGAINTVINSLTTDTTAIGNYSDASTRNKPISGDTLTDSSDMPWLQGRQWLSRGSYTVGSVSNLNGISNYDDDDGSYYSKAAIWNNGTLIVVEWDDIDEEDNYYYAQGSMRGFYVTESNQFYGVGYNNYDNQHMDATIFYGSSTDLTNLNSRVINGTKVDQDGEGNVYSNSVATDINENLVVVGEAKRSGRYPEDGAAPNRLFYVEDASVASNDEPDAIFFNDIDSNLFFNSAGGKMGGINHFNEVVGRVDSEDNREYEGKQRRQRAFIYPLGMIGQTDSTLESAINTRKNSIFQGRDWLLDDLTNDGEITGNNNQYRIYDATDINDAGVISATALKCAGGYDSTANDAYCGDGNIDETVVAVKLVPINVTDEFGEITMVNIEARGYEYNEPVAREGASMSFGFIGILALFSLIRRYVSLKLNKPIFTY